MAKEHWYFFYGVLAIVLPLALLLAVKKLNLLEIRADQVIGYKTVDGQQLTLHHFAAQNVGESAPALLLLHGGGWLYGRPEAFYRQCEFFAAQGIHCLSASYRLKPQSDGRPNMSGAIQDARDAFDYLFENAAALNIDGNRIALGGGSAGGHLAAAVGVNSPPMKNGDRRPAALVLYNPILDLSPGHPHHYLAGESWPTVSPLQHIDTATPATLILVGREDAEVPIDTVNAYCAAMQNQDATCEAEVYAGQAHGFFNYAPNNLYFAETNHRVLAFLGQL